MNKYIGSLPELCLFSHTGCFWSKIDIKLNPNLMWHCKAKFVTNEDIIFVTKKLEEKKHSTMLWKKVIRSLFDDDDDDDFNADDDDQTHSDRVLQGSTTHAALKSEVNIVK